MAEMLNNFLVTDQGIAQKSCTKALSNLENLAAGDEIKQRRRVTSKVGLE